MSFLTKLALFAAAAGSVFAQQPTFTSADITNAASYVSSELPNGSLAKGGLVVLKGTNLGPATAPTFSPYPLRTTIDGTSVRVTVGGTSVDALMFYTSDKQISFLLPSNTPEGSGTLVVTYNGRQSSAVPVRIAASAFGIFTWNQAGSGPGIFQNVYSATDLRVNSLTESARPGQSVAIWGTGLGPVAQDESRGPVPGDLPINVEVYVGGKRATVTYKGRSGCCVSDQINFIVPEGVEGCYVPVVVKIGAVVSNFATISIARNNGACSDPTGLTPSQLESAQRNGSMRIGAITLTRSVTKISVPGAQLRQRPISAAAVSAVSISTNCWFPRASVAAGLPLRLALATYSASAAHPRFLSMLCSRLRSTQVPSST